MSVLAVLRVDVINESRLRAYTSGFMASSATTAERVERIIDPAAGHLMTAEISGVEVTAVEFPRIEIVHERDPDSACDHTVFVNGVRADQVEVYGVDPGAGWERAGWDESTADMVAAASPAAGRYLKSRRDEVASSSPYIEP